MILTDLLLGAQEECGITEEELLQYPHCNIKMGVRNIRTGILNAYNALTWTKLLFNLLCK